MRALILFTLFLCTACATEKKAKNLIPLSPQQLQQQSLAKEELQQAQADLESENFDKALLGFEKIQQNYPHTFYFFAARIGQAQSIAGMGQYVEAAAILKDTREATATVQPTLAAQALYQLSYCHEALGEDSQAIAVLLDSLKVKERLPVEVGEAEIPVRLAMLYSKVQNATESDYYLNLAQKGLQNLQGKNDFSKYILAKAYYQMGIVSTNQISSENFLQVLRGALVVQVYLFRAINMQVQPWADQAALLLKKSYRDFWNVLVIGPDASAASADTRQRELYQMQTQFGAELLNLVDDAESHLPLEKEKLNPSEVDVQKYIADTKGHIEKIIYEPKALMDLTAESRKMQSFQRSARVKNKNQSKSRSQIDSGQQPVKQTPVVDPNL